MSKKAKRIVMANSDKEFLSTLNQDRSMVKVDNREVFLKSLVSQDGTKSVVWKAVDKYDIPFALKLATHEDYIDRSYHSEMLHASKLHSFSHFARLEAAQVVEFNHKNRAVKCVAFIEEWVDGVSLEDLDCDKVNIAFILNYIHTLCEALNILKTHKLRHDDLHTRNVLIAKQKPGTLIQALEVKIVDQGSLKDYHAPLSPFKNGLDDVGNFTLHIQLLLNKLQNTSSGDRRILTSKEALFVSECVEVLNSMGDPDKTRALTSPYHIYQTFANLWNSISIPRARNTKLTDPFDYISAEQISDDRLLIKLFADSCPWIKEITSPNPVLLTGPRGCGKSMIFRRYSLKALLSVDDPLINELQIAGFYISCSADLSNRLGVITNQSHANIYKNEIIHYFNLILLREILVTLRMIVDKAQEDRFGLTPNVQDDIFRFITSQLRISHDRKLSLQGVSPITHLLELVKFETNHTYTAIVSQSNLIQYTTASFLADVTRFLAEKIPYLEKSKITFLIDDYSVHRIPDHVQELLNMIIWDRQSTHIFKVSSEKYGTVRSMHNNTSADLSREYTEIDVGRSYMNLSESTKELKKFAAELLNHRLKLAGYKGTADGLLGSSTYSEGSLGKQIHSGKDANQFFHGIETIAQVCSGDISTLLEIYRAIFRESNVTEDVTERISPGRQHSAITTTSKNFLELTKSFHPHGTEMYKIVMQFGNLCKRILLEGRLQKNILPNETTRIEVEENETVDNFSAFTESVYKELIRRAIFIELESSRGRHTLGPTMRLQLRRIYCPSFGLSLSKNTAIKWSQSDFKLFLTEPEMACEHEFKKWHNTSQPQLPFK